MTGNINGGIWVKFKDKRPPLKKTVYVRQEDIRRGNALWFAYQHDIDEIPQDWEWLDEQPVVPLAVVQKLGIALQNLKMTIDAISETSRYWTVEAGNALDNFNQYLNTQK